MTCPLVLILLVSVTLAVLGYWRAFRLHIRIREIEPRCPWMTSNPFGRMHHRKDKR